MCREYNRQTSPIDPSTPSRTLNPSGTTIRLFEARTFTNARVILKEFLPKAKRLAKRELQVKVDGRRWTVERTVPRSNWGGTRALELP